jgi:hypothetical protein
MFSLVRGTVTLMMFVLVTFPVFAQTYPTFGPEIKVTITGLTFDAMEPCVVASLRNTSKQHRENFQIRRLMICNRVVGIMLNPKC